MGVGHELGAMFRQFRAEIAALEAGEPEFVRLYGAISAADHLKFQIGDNVFERHRRMLKKILVALAAGLLAAEEDEQHRALWGLFMGQGARQLQHGNAAGSVVVRAVVDTVTVNRLARANVVQVGREQDDLVFQFFVMALEFADDVASVPLLFALAIEIEFTRDVLNITAIVAGRLDADFTQLRSEISGGEQFVMGSAAAALQRVTGKKLHGAADMRRVDAGLLSRGNSYEAKKTAE